MRQGVIFNGRVRLLMAKGQKTYRPRRKGERKRKSVRGCIVGHDIRVLALSIEKKGENDIPGLTDTYKPLRLGPKRASKIRKLHGISSGKNSYALVSQKVVRRKFKSATGKDRHKAPNVQRLVTAERLYRKKQWNDIKKSRFNKTIGEWEEYNKLIANWKKEKAAEKVAAAKEALVAEQKKAEKKAPVSVPKKTVNKKK